KGTALWKERGYNVVVAPHVLDTNPNNSYLAGLDEDRARDLNAFFERTDIDAIQCAGGGYGSIRLLSQIKWDVVRENPKVFIGYSDITTLHLAIARKAGFVTIHGAMLGTLLKSNAETRAQFFRTMEDPSPFGVLPTAQAEIKTLVPGVAEGRLAGGCLTLLAHSCGTPYAPDFRGKIVLIEDVGEAIYRADRYLSQLKLAGHLERVAGFVVGEISSWRKNEENPERNTPENLWRDLLAPFGKPAITGFPFGHQKNPLSLPLGVHARLDATNGTLALLEAATEPA
ncbi:MAG: LD-carboxypeptidase, partial [Armatimonadetes bacterium]|nr:LD-carboxypeptidase [Armatimonadota bacterium]